MRPRETLTPEQERDLEAIDGALAGAAVESQLRDLEELVLDVRATAPQMSPGFAARLEHELSEGFPAPREQPSRVRRPGRRWLLLPAVGSLAAVVVALVVVFGDGGDQRPLGARAEPAPTASSAARARSTPSVDLNRSQRKVEHSASLALQAPEGGFDSATDAVNATVARFGGIVASAQIGASDADGGEATYDLRIPSDRLNRALAALAQLGHVTERSQSLEDITGSFGSAQERLTDARAERRGLLRALERATTQAQIDSLKAQLRGVGGRIGRLKGQLASLRRRADLATVGLTIRSTGEAGETGGGAWTPGDAAGDAVRVLEVLAGVLLIALALLVPAGLIVALIALAVRFGRRRRREAALDPA